MKNAALVYQAGIANVFQTDCDTHPLFRKRLFQSDFRRCEAFARGLEAAGVKLVSLYCNQASDIANADWYSELDNAPFSDKFQPVGEYVR